MQTWFSGSGATMDVRRSHRAASMKAMDELASLQFFNCVLSCCSRAYKTPRGRDIDTAFDVGASALRAKCIWWLRHRHNAANIVAPIHVQEVRESGVLYHRAIGD